MKQGDTESEPTSECAALVALKILGRKWITYILCELIRGDSFFSDLKKNIEGNYGEKISSRVLSESLRNLEDQSIIQRNVLNEKSPIRVKYSLTRKGEDFQIIFGVLKGYGVKWGGIEQKMCKSHTCMHSDCVPIIDTDKVADLI
ncbi:MAG: winged helix-turn-helix transcriptional regulator [Candidatus Hodarchaeales archaeon]